MLRFAFYLCFTQVTFLKKIYLFIYFGCAGSSLLHGLLFSYGIQGLLVAVFRLLTVRACLVMEHRLQVMQASAVVARRLLKQELSSWSTCIVRCYVVCGIFSDQDQKELAGVLSVIF